MTDKKEIGFIGLGVMGEPMARNLLRKSGSRLHVFDLSHEPVERLSGDGAQASSSIAELTRSSDVILLSLPSGSHVDKVVTAPGGILENARAGQIVVDLSTSPMTLARTLAAKLEPKGLRFADAPVARTRQAAIDGTLSIMVGAEEAVYAEIEPLLRCMATEVTHCGCVGAGQVVKILNNMVLFQTVNALAEALAVGRRAGVDANILFDTFAKGSADSFALRNHGMKAMLPNSFPLRAFSTDYARKDLSYALELGEQLGIDMAGARAVDARLEASSEAGYSEEYFPALVKVVDRAPGKA